MQFLIALMLLAVPYSEARETAIQTGKPLFIVVGADWCPACKTLQNSTIPKMQRDGTFPDVIYCTVDVDREEQIGSWLQKQANTTSVPVLVVYRKVNGAWKGRYHVGTLDAAKLRVFLQARKE